MAFYDDWLVPRILNFAMGMKPITEQRKKCLAGVRGTVLEVGFGSGLNLPWYPEGVERVLAVDPSTEGAKLARRRIGAARFSVEYVALEGEKIAAPDASFDAVVSTFTLCTIPDALAALGQMRRVMKPHGRFFFVEHGLSGEVSVQRWQHRLNPWQQRMCGGCNLNRDIEDLVRTAGFSFDELEKYYIKGPKPMSFMTRGVARIASA